MLDSNGHDVFAALEMWFLKFDHLKFALSHIVHTHAQRTHQINAPTPTLFMFYFLHTSNFFVVNLIQILKNRSIVIHASVVVVVILFYSTHSRRDTPPNLLHMLPLCSCYFVVVSVAFFHSKSCCRCFLLIGLANQSFMCFDFNSNVC